MLAAMALATVLTASPGTGSSVHLGMDASQLKLTLLGSRPTIDETLLPLAPTSPQVALAASVITTSAGLFMMGAFLVLELASLSLFPIGVAIAGISLGFLLFDFGPQVGDLLNGDWGRFLGTGLLRIAGLVLFFVPYVGGFAWLAWIVRDVIDSQYAPHRWVERHLSSSGAGVSARIEPLQSPPGEPSWATGNLFAVEF